MKRPSLMPCICGSVMLFMTLQSATELGVFDVLQKAGDAAKLSAKEIALQLSCNNPEAPSMLDRVLVLLASHNILNCSLIPDNQNLGSFHRVYSITPVAKFFARNSNGVSLGPLMTLTQDKIFLQSWVHGTHAFEYPSLDTRFNQVFNTAMINHTTLVMKKALECYIGFEDIKRLVDIGGGLGITISLITAKYPHIQGINFDLPHVIQHAPSCPGVEHVAGDMFESVPKGDAIFMMWILGVSMMTQNPGGKERTKEHSWNWQLLLDLVASDTYVMFVPSGLWNSSSRGGHFLSCPCNCYFTVS